MASFQQSFPHFPQWKRWMGKSGEKWWKMEGISGVKICGIRWELESILSALETNKYKAGR